MVVQCELKILLLAITVRHHSASLMMPKSYPHDGIFNPYLTTIKDSYILFTCPRHFPGTLNVTDLMTASPVFQMKLITIRPCMIFSWDVKLAGNQPIVEMKHLKV